MGCVKIIDDARSPFISRSCVGATHGSGLWYNSECLMWHGPGEALVSYDNSVFWFDLRNDKVMLHECSDLVHFGHVPHQHAHMVGDYDNDVSASPQSQPSLPQPSQSQPALPQSPQPQMSSSKPQISSSFVINKFTCFGDLLVVPFDSGGVAFLKHSPPSHLNRQNYPHNNTNNDNMNNNDVNNNNNNMHNSMFRRRHHQATTLVLPAHTNQGNDPFTNTTHHIPHKLRKSKINFRGVVHTHLPNAHTSIATVVCGIASNERQFFFTGGCDCRVSLFEVLRESDVRLCGDFSLSAACRGSCQVFNPPFVMDITPVPWNDNCVVVASGDGSVVCLSCDIQHITSNRAARRHVAKAQPTKTVMNCVCRLELHTSSIASLCWPSPSILASGGTDLRVVLSRMQHVSTQHVSTQHVSTEQESFLTTVGEINVGNKVNDMCGANDVLCVGSLSSVVQVYDIARLQTTT